MSSQNINQIFIANPITSNLATDLMYFGRSPYGLTDDTAMLYSDFAAQFAGNVLSAKGDLYTFTTVNARLAVGPTNGQILQVNSVTTTGLAWSSATYPTTTTINQILYSSSNNVVDQLVTANSAALVTTAVGVPTFTGTMTNGQIIIGSTGATPVAATISSGSNISVTNGAGTITIAATGIAGFFWTNVTTGTQALAIDKGYITDNGASLVTYTLPVLAPQGSVIEIVGFSPGLFTVTQNAGQSINFGNQTTTITTGSITSTNANDSVRLLCVQANTIFTVIGGVGNFTIV